MVQASMQIDTGGPQRVAVEEEEKKDDQGLPVPVTREPHVPGDPYKFDMFKYIKMGTGYVSECYLYKAEGAE